MSDKLKELSDAFESFDRHDPKVTQAVYEILLPRVIKERLIMSTINSKKLSDWIEERLSAMQMFHRAWGNLESTELQFLLLIDLRNEILYGKTKEGLDHEWSKILKEHGYIPSLALSHQLQDTPAEQWDILSRLLGEYRLRTKQDIDFNDSADGI